MIHASYSPLWSFEQGGQFLLPLLQTGGERGSLVRTQAPVALGWVARSQVWTQTTWSGRSNDSRDRAAKTGTHIPGFSHEPQVVPCG